MHTFEAVDTLIQNSLNDVAPAITLAVYYQGNKVVDRAYGYIDPQTKLKPVLTTTPFDLASITKLFTVTAFLLQVDDGKVKIDDPVISVLPEFGAQGDRPIEGGQNPHTMEREPATATGTIDIEKVTFRHLLTHTGGLAPWRDLFLNVGDIPPAPLSGTSVDHLARMKTALDLIAGYGYVSPLGETVNYSDLGLITLGAAVAKIDGVNSLDQVIYERVSSAVTFNPPRPEPCAPTEFDQRWRKRRIKGEVHDENACALGGIAGHAGLFATADQVAQLGLRWLLALQGKDTYLSQTVAQEAITRAKDDRGLGWVLRSPQLSSSGNYFSENSFGHTGFTGTSLWVDPDDALVVSLMTNRVYFGRESLAILPFRRKLHDAVALWVNAL